MAEYKLPASGKWIDDLLDLAPSLSPGDVVRTYSQAQDEAARRILEPRGVVVVRSNLALTESGPVDVSQARKIAERLFRWLKGDS